MSRHPSQPHARLAALAFLFTGFLPGAIAAQEDAEAPRPMTIVDLIEIPSLGDPQVSPDGSQVLYVRSDADWGANRTVSHIWRVNADGSDARQMTNGEDGESSPRWSPDGTTIAFLAERGDGNGEGEEERRQVHLISNTGGEARRLTEHPTAVSDIAWSPDGRWIYFVARDEKTEEEKAREEVKDNVFRFEEDRKSRHLWRVDAETGETERVTEGDFDLRGYALSRDGSLVVHHRAPTPLFDDLLNAEVWVMAADGSGARRLTENEVGEAGAELSPDNASVLFRANTNDDLSGFYYNVRLFVMPAAGGAPRSVVPGGAYDIDGAAWSSDGEAIYFRANTGLRQQLYRVELASGEIVPLTAGDHAVGAWDFEPRAGLHVFSVNDPTNPGDLWALAEGEADGTAPGGSAAGGAPPRRVTRVFADLAERFRLPRVEAVTWRGADGVEVEGLLYHPLEGTGQPPYPLVVQTHGGPASSDRFAFPNAHDYEAVLAARGWLVFKPNYRGSTGYGDAFLRDMVGHYFHQAHLDVMTGVDHLIERGLADPERMVKMGWSAGGHMTNKIITFTDRFQAASSGAGAANWISMYAQSDVRIYRTPWFGGAPWGEDAPLDQYRGDSPLFDVHRVTTPTLVLVGEDDPRVPMPQSVELYRALKHNGVPTHLYVAPNQGHGWRELQQRLFKANVELDWFERWALDREYEWERSPVHPAEEEGEAGTTAAADEGADA